MNKPEQLANATNGVIVFNQAPTLPHDSLSATRAVIKKIGDQKSLKDFGKDASIATGEILAKAA